jgi:hypothetical protein
MGRSSGGIMTTRGGETKNAAVGDTDPPVAKPWTLDRLLSELTSSARMKLDFQDAHAIAGAEADPDEARRRLLPFLEHPDEEVRERAGGVLFHIGAPEGIEWLFFRLAENPRSTLVDLSRGPRRPVPAGRLEMVVGPKLDTMLADVAVGALARYRTASTEQLLLLALEHVDRRAREAALTALVLSDPPFDFSPEVIDAAIEQLDVVTEAYPAVNAIRRIVRLGPASAAERAANALGEAVMRWIRDEDEYDSSDISSIASLVSSALEIVVSVQGERARPVLDLASSTQGLSLVKSTALKLLAGIDADGDGRARIVAALRDPKLATSAAKTVLEDPEKYRAPVVADALLEALRAAAPDAKRQRDALDALRSGAHEDPRALKAEILALSHVSAKSLANALLAVRGPEAVDALVDLAWALEPAMLMRLRWIKEGITPSRAADLLTRAGLSVETPDDPDETPDDPKRALDEMMESSGRIASLYTDTVGVPDYEHLLERLADASGGAFAPANISQSETPEEGQSIRVTFEHRGRSYAFDVTYEGVRCDIAATVSAANRVLADDGIDERFVALELTGPFRRYVFGRPSPVRDAAELLYFPMPAER